MSKPNWNALKNNNKIKYTYPCQPDTCLTVPSPLFFPSNIIIIGLVLPVKKETKHLCSLGAEPYQRAQTRRSHSEKTTHMHAHNAARWMGPLPQHNGAKLNHWCQIEKKKRVVVVGGGTVFGRGGQNALPFTSLTYTGKDRLIRTALFACLMYSGLGKITVGCCVWSISLHYANQTLLLLFSGHPFMVAELIILAPWCRFLSFSAFHTWHRLFVRDTYSILHQLLPDKRTQTNIDYLQKCSR